MIYVTHDQEEAMTLGHRIVVMRDGVIQQADTPELIYNTPKNAFVARFIGSPPMNLFTGMVRERQGKLIFASEDDSVDIALPPAWQRPLQPLLGRSIFLGIRPENISGRSERDYHEGVPQRPSDVVVPVTATAVEMLGPQKLLYFYIGKELAVASLEPDHPARATETIETLWHGHKLHIFDGESEERLDLRPEAVSAY
jgi:multiple sugar transport system ATP-binding protein